MDILDQVVDINVFIPYTEIDVSKFAVVNLPFVILLVDVWQQHVSAEIKKNLQFFKCILMYYQWCITYSLKWSEM